MVLYFDRKTMAAPKVWVKVGERKKGDNFSVFVDNEALAKIGIGSIKMFGICDEWLISDKYYAKMVQEGKFVPIDDLSQCDMICEKLGWPDYIMDLEF